MDTPEQAATGKEQKARLAALFIAATVAIVSIMPLERHGQHHFYNVLAVALVPALIAWLLIRERPARQGPAMFRGVALVVALVGLGGLGLLLAAPGHLGGLIKETVESRGFAIQAGAYLAAGLLGLAGSFLFAPED